MSHEDFKQFLRAELVRLGKRRKHTLAMGVLNIGGDVQRSLPIQESEYRVKLARHILTAYAATCQGVPQPNGLEFVAQSKFDRLVSRGPFCDLLAIVSWGGPDGEQHRFYVQVPSSVGHLLRLRRFIIKSAHTT